MEYITLNDGVRIPVIGFGVFMIPNDGSTYIKEIGMPTRFSEMGITDEEILRKAADTCILTGGCARELPRDEIFELLKEVL